MVLELGGAPWEAWLVEERAELVKLKARLPDDEEDEKRQHVTKAVDQLRAKYGERVISRGGMRRV